MGDVIQERIYKSVWHLALVGVGIYELQHHKSKVGKVLATGIIAFHLDAFVTDAFGLEKCLSRRLLEKVLMK